jgi:hypothetical protein
MRLGSTKIGKSSAEFKAVQLRAAFFFEEQGRMAGIHPYSTTAASNTTLNGMAVSDSTVPSNLDNIVRQQMANEKMYAEDIGGKNVSAGTDTITLTTSSTVTAYYDGLRQTFIAGGTNTGAATLNVDGVGAKAVRKGADAALAAGDITAAMPVDVVYDASANGAAGAWMLLNPYNGTQSFQPLDADLTTLASAFTTASASGAASLKFAEDTDNGSNTVTIQGPASAASDKTITLPDLTGTLMVTGKQTIWIPASAMTPQTTNGAASASSEEATNDVMTSYLAFDSTTAEYAQADVYMPKSYDGGTVTAVFVWMHPATVTNFDVRWGVAGRAFTDGSTRDAAFGTTIERTDTGGSTATVYRAAETTAVTIANTPAGEKMVTFRFNRDPADAADNMAVDAYLIGVAIHFTTNAADDT